MLYNETTLDHIHRPRHMGKLENATGCGLIGEEECGDFMSVFVRVEDDVIRDISFVCRGCVAAVACGSAACELANGKTLREAVYITEETVCSHLGGLPSEKVHCAGLAVSALRHAIADHLGIKQEQERTPFIERLREKARRAAEEAGLLGTPLKVEIRKLPPEEAIGNTPERDYPIWKGKEGIVEARIMESAGQAFTSAPGDFEGELAGVLDLDLSGTDAAAVRNRGIFVASVNALCRHLGITGGTVHCRDEGPRECADDLARAVKAGSPNGCRIALIGCQPRMIEALSDGYHLRVIDLDPDNIGKPFSGITVEGEEMTDDALETCDIALVTGTTLVNGTIDRFLNLKCHTVFYGTTIAGAAALMGLRRFCTRSL